MVCKTEYRSPKSTKHVEVGRFGGQCHRGGRQGRLAIETGASQARAGQEVCDWFQVSPKILASDLENTMPSLITVNYIANNQQLSS